MTALLKGGAVHSILENYPDMSSHKYAERNQHIADKFTSSEVGTRYFSLQNSREVKFGMLANGGATSFSDKKAIFRGAVDYMCIDESGTLNLIDWKTGRYKDEKWQDFNQLLFYAIHFFNQKPNINQIRISYVYVEHNEENSITLNRNNLSIYKESLFNSINAIETDVEFKKSESRLCDWCPYKDNCINKTNEE